MIEEKTIAVIAAKLLRPIMSANHRRRRRTVWVAVWLLRQVRDAEMDKAYRYSNELERLDSMPGKVSRSKYNEVEEEYLSCEDALGFLETAIEELEFAY